MASGSIPQLGFLFSIAGLSVTLAGFSGLVSAFRRGDQLRPVDAYRLRQIPEMGLATALLVLVTIPLADTTGSGTIAIRIEGGLALVFTVLHILALSARGRRNKFRQPTGGKVAAGVIRLAIGVTTGACIALGASSAYEWLVVFLLARPMLAFVLVLTDMGVSATPGYSSLPPSNRRSNRDQHSLEKSYGSHLHVSHARARRS
ncbi:MAG: hypothetical protein ACHQ0J_02325 [Candidatus Dormibacterales bacterium]